MIGSKQKMINIDWSTLTVKTRTNHLTDKINVFRRKAYIFKINIKLPIINESKMKSYKKLYLEKDHSIKTTSYNYDAPIKILRYIIYLRKILDKKFKKMKSNQDQKHINIIIDKILDITSDIEYFEDERIDLLNLPLWEIKKRLRIFQKRIDC